MSGAGTISEGNNLESPYRRYYNQLELKGRPAPYMPHTGHAFITARPKSFQRPYYWGNIATMAMRPMF